MTFNHVIFKWSHLLHFVSKEVSEQDLSQPSQNEYGRDKLRLFPYMAI